jgi:hypothetical protein
MRLQFMSPFVPVCLLVGFESLIRYVERDAVLRQVQRDNVLLALTCIVTKDIQGNGVQPLPKVQDTDLTCRGALEGIIGTKERFLNDVFSITSTSCQAQGKKIEPLLVDLYELSCRKWQSRSVASKRRSSISP